MGTRIILASSSMVRKYIMTRTGLPFEVQPPDIDERAFDGLSLVDRVLAIAREKARVVSAEHPVAFVIAADTLTRDPISGTVFSKPADRAVQRAQALDLSGRSIEVLSGVCIIDQGRELESTTTRSMVTYQPFDSRTLDRLIRRDRPEIRSSVLGMFFDAAGFTLVESVHGSYTGAMGLPMEIVYRNLKRAAPAQHLGQRPPVRRQAG